MMISVMSGSVWLLVLVLSVGYRVRYHVYYWYIHVRAKRKAYRELEDMGNYKFDAFVSYNNKDTSWVVHQLRPRLEGRYVT